MVGETRNGRIPFENMFNGASRVEVVLKGKMFSWKATSLGIKATLIERSRTL